jgi:hypothetical protein
MGTFGTDISENDIYMDLEIEFFDLYNQGIDIKTITKRIIKAHNESYDSDEYSNDFWFALADFQWQCKSLDDNVFKKVKEIVNSKSDLKLWKELDSNSDDIFEREKKLNEFIEKISVQKKRAKVRVKKKLYNSIFTKGDLIIYKLNNGNYGGSLIIEDEKETEFGLNLVILSDINSKKKPTLKDFRNAKIQYIQEKLIGQPIRNYPLSIYLYGKWYLEEIDESYEFEVIKNISISDFNADFKVGYFHWVILKDNPYTIENGIQLKNWIKNKNWLQQWFCTIAEIVNKQTAKQE